MLTTKLLASEIVARAITAEDTLDGLFAETLSVDLDQGILVVHSPEERYWIGGSHIIAIDLCADMEALEGWLYNARENGALQICDDIAGCSHCTYGPGEEEGRAPSTNQDSVPAFITHIA
jgi:hypothetical protein